MVRAVIFDMDGLMFDTEPIWGKAWHPALARFGLAYPEGLADACRGTNGAVRTATVNRMCGIDYGDKVAAALDEETARLLKTELRMKPGLVELLDWLDGHGVPRAVASSSSVEMIESNLQTAGIADRFQATVSGVGIGHSKPEPDIFLAAAAALGVEPSRALVLEDSYAGVEAGHRGGFVTVMVPDMMPPTDKTRAWAAATCGSLLEVRDLLAAGAL